MDKTVTQPTNRPPWRNEDESVKPGQEPQFIPPKPPFPLLKIVKKLWFPLLLLPMTVIIIDRAQGQPNLPDIPQQLPFTFTTTPSPESGLEDSCEACPEYSPPAADFCRDGKIIPGEIDECGCQLPPTCSRSSTQPNGGCAIGGCNSELCLEESQSDKIFSICLYRPEHACYKSATCERQSGGKCGWTQTPALLACLEEKRSQ